VRFDERFTFHFYDMDFCREVERKGLRMGTWPISVVHESGGAFGSQGWQDGYAKYLAKYPDDESVPPPPKAEGAQVKAIETTATAGSVSVHKANVYQIFYDAQTKKMLDPGFIPLDNVGQRPDWCEYWPIRNFLLNNANSLDEGAFYGFLSPKFQSKAGLSSQQVRNFVATMGDSVDVLAFSPFFDQAVLCPNVFEQGVVRHPNAISAFVAAADKVVPGVALNTLVTDSTNTVFCNYFLAKPRFWRHWLDRAEIVFDIAERNDTPLGKALNESTRHNGVESFQTKVFFMERLVTLLLSTEPDWQVKFYDPEALPMAGAYARDLSAENFACVKVELAAMDRLKQAARATGQKDLMPLHKKAVAEFCEKYHGDDPRFESAWQG
jgi:hypothetical protein